MNLEQRAKKLIKDLKITKDYILERSAKPDGILPYGELLELLRDNGIPKTSGAEIADKIMEILDIKNEKPVKASTTLVVADAALGNDSALATALFDLLKNTRELEYMAHQFHWNIVGVKFNTMHEFYEEEYKQLFEDQDEIAEQIRQQGFFVPVINNVLLEENYSASGFEEQLIAYAGKLTQNIALIEKVNGLANNEIAVQDLCARLKGLRSLSLNLKVKAMLGANKMSLEPVEASVVESAAIDSKNKEILEYLKSKGIKARWDEDENEVWCRYKTKDLDVDILINIGERGRGIGRKVPEGKYQIDVYDYSIRKYWTNHTILSDISKIPNYIKDILDGKIKNLGKEQHRELEAVDCEATAAVDLSISKDTEKELEKLGFKVLPNEQVEDDDEASVAIRKNEDDSFDVIEYENGYIHLRNAPGKRALMNGKYKKEFKFNDVKSLINYLKKSKATASAVTAAKELFKKGDIVNISGDISSNGYNVRVSSTGVVEENQKRYNSKVLVNIDEIDGDKKVSMFVNPKIITLASAVTAGFDKGRYKEIDEESKFFKILKNDCDIRPKNFYAINKGLRLAIKVIKGTFEDASIRFFALKNKGGYVRVELKDKVYIVGYTIYESGKIKVWTRELKSNVPVNSFDYDMLNMYAKPLGTKLISGLVPTWMSI